MKILKDKEDNLCLKSNISGASSNYYLYLALQIHQQYIILTRVYIIILDYSVYSDIFEDHQIMLYLI